MIKLVHSDAKAMFYESLWTEPVDAHAMYLGVKDLSPGHCHDDLSQVLQLYPRSQIQLPISFCRWLDRCLCSKSASLAKV